MFRYIDSKCRVKVSSLAVQKCTNVKVPVTKIRFVYIVFKKVFSVNIYFDDCGRTLLSGGYGEFGRGVLVGLLKTTEFQIFVAKEYYSKLLTFLDSIEIEKKNLKRWDEI